MAKNLPRNNVGYVISNQVLRAGTSIGANIIEAESAFSKKDFTFKMSIAKKEAQETKYWLNLILDSGLIKKENLNSLIQEAEELIKILVTIVKKAQVRDEG